MRHGDGVVLQTEWHCRSAGAGAAQTVRRMRHRVRMEAEVYAQYQTVIADCGIEIEQSEALVL